MKSIRLFEPKSKSSVISDDVIVSPIPYMGNKKRLIDKGLIRMFPNEIRTFVDLFAGSGIVSMNTVADRIIINDIDSHLIELYNLFNEHSADEIIRHIENRIKQFGLATETTRRNVYKDSDKIVQYKSAYIKLRDEYNANKSVFDFCTLMYFSFSQQFRFNADGDFNMPCGDDYFSEYQKESIINGCNFFQNRNIEICNMDFKSFDISNLTERDFVYLDPPYFITLAVYTEGRNEYAGWSESDEKALYQLCERLDSRNIKFGMSNVFRNKGRTNQSLIDWSRYHNFNVHRFSTHTYSACGKGNSMAEEVFITNY
ncbi:MAG: Dam family site-specific DNA-(adenine-N6)-methyltransferase [Ruminococcus flavefaciens]|nr:Dam family site-specific DNA-(adenine-N6)-methyltransferase [Ruminococcus flavefaciens]